MEEDITNITKSEESDIINRKGRVIMSREFILNQNEQTLREIFCNFFPIAINTYHDLTYYDSIEYLGVSPHFDIVEIGCACPRYQITLHYNEDGSVKFQSFNKETPNNLF